MARAKNRDEQVMNLIKEIARQKADIAKLERPNWLTNCSFTYVENNLNGAVNLHVETNIKNLISYAAYLQEKETSYLAMSVVLGVEEPPKYTWNGFSIADWVEDIRIRINKVNISKKREKLERLESRLNAIISPELRAELELQAIAGELGK